MTGIRKTLRSLNPVQVISSAIVGAAVVGGTWIATSGEEAADLKGQLDPASTAGCTQWDAYEQPPVQPVTADASFLFKVTQAVLPDTGDQFFGGEVFFSLQTEKPDRYSVKDGEFSAEGTQNDVPFQLFNAPQEAVVYNGSNAGNSNVVAHPEVGQLIVPLRVDEFDESGDPDELDVLPTLHLPLPAASGGTTTECYVADLPRGGSVEVQVIRMDDPYRDPSLAAKSELEGS